MTTNAELAEQAADAIRALNHRTIGSAGQITVPDLYRLTVDVSRAVDGLPQLLEQLSQHLEARSDRGGLRLDGYGLERYSSPQAAIGTAQLALSEATSTARALAELLDEALQVISTIGDRSDDDSEDDDEEHATDA